MKSFNELREKTLTPAEKKKREEIAQAIERDNPGMDMSKKMAIATAQAKKVAEEVEQVDELKQATLQSYAKKALKTATGKKVQKRIAGRMSAIDRLAGVHTVKTTPDDAESKPLATKKYKKYKMESSEYKMVNGKKMRWDNVKNMWVPVSSEFGEGYFSGKDIEDKENEANPGMRSPRKKPAAPFDGPYKKKTSVVPGKHGEGPSTARHLARMGLKQHMKGQPK